MSFADFFGDPTAMESLLSQLATRHVLLPASARTSALDQFFQAHLIPSRERVQLILPERLDDPVRYDLSQTERPAAARSDFGRAFFEALERVALQIPTIESSRSDAGAKEDRALVDAMVATLTESPHTFRIEGIVDDGWGQPVMFAVFQEELREQMQKEFATIATRNVTRMREEAERAEARRGQHGAREVRDHSYDLGVAVHTLRAAGALNRHYRPRNDGTLYDEPVGLKGLVANWRRVTKSDTARPLSEREIVGFARDTEWRLSRRFDGSAMINPIEMHDSSEAMKQAVIAKRRETLDRRIASVGQALRDPNATLTPAQRDALQGEYDTLSDARGRFEQRVTARDGMRTMVDRSHESQAQRRRFARDGAFESDIRSRRGAIHASLIDEQVALQKQLTIAREELFGADLPSLVRYTHEAASREVESSLWDHGDVPDVHESYAPVRYLRLDLARKLEPRSPIEVERSIVSRIIAGSASPDELDSINYAATQLRLPLAAIDALAQNPDITHWFSAQVAHQLRLLAAAYQSGDEEILTSLAAAGLPVHEIHSSAPDRALTARDVAAFIALAKQHVEGSDLADLAAALPKDIPTRLPHGDSLDENVRYAIEHAHRDARSEPLTVAVDPSLLRDAILANPEVQHLERVIHDDLAKRLTNLACGPDQHIEQHIQKANRATLAQLSALGPAALEQAQLPRDIALSTALVYSLGQLQYDVAQHLAERNAAPPQLVDQLRQTIPSVSTRTPFAIAPALAIDRSSAGERTYGLPVISERSRRVTRAEGEVVALHVLATTTDGTRVERVRITGDTPIAIDDAIFEKQRSIDSVLLPGAWGGQDLAPIAAVLAVVEHESNRTIVPIHEISTVQRGAQQSGAYDRDPSVPLLEALLTRTPVRFERSAGLSGITLHVPQLQREQVLEQATIVNNPVRAQDSAPRHDEPRSIEDEIEHLLSRPDLAAQVLDSGTPTTEVPQRRIASAYTHDRPTTIRVDVTDERLPDGRVWGCEIDPTNAHPLWHMLPPECANSSVAFVTVEPQLFSPQLAYRDTLARGRDELDRAYVQALEQKARTILHAPDEQKVVFIPANEPQPIPHSAPAKLLFRTHQAAYYGVLQAEQNTLALVELPLSATPVRPFSEQQSLRARGLTTANSPAASRKRALSHTEPMLLPTSGTLSFDQARYVLMPDADATEAIRSRSTTIAVMSADALADSRATARSWFVAHSDRDELTLTSDRVSGAGTTMEAQDLLVVSMPRTMLDNHEEITPGTVLTLTPADDSSEHYHAHVGGLRARAHDEPLTLAR